jgi:hypothetical protein
MSNSRCRQSIYCEREIADAVEAEAKRLSRPLSWVVQRCVKIGLPHVRALPDLEAVEVEVVREAAE